MTCPLCEQKIGLYRKAADQKIPNHTHLTYAGKCVRHEHHCNQCGAIFRLQASCDYRNGADLRLGWNVRKLGD